MQLPSPRVSGPGSFRLEQAKQEKERSEIDLTFVETCLFGGVRLLLFLGLRSLLTSLYSKKEIRGRYRCAGIGF